LNCAAGLDTPSSGAVLVDGHDLTTLRPDDLTRFRRSHIGFVFQAYNLIGHFTARENVRLPWALAGRAPDPAWEGHLLDLLGVADLADRLPGELSGARHSGSPSPALWSPGPPWCSRTSPPERWTRAP